MTFSSVLVLSFLAFSSLVTSNDSNYDYQFDVSYETPLQELVDFHGSENGYSYILQPKLTFNSHVDFKVNGSSIDYRLSGISFVLNFNIMEARLLPSTTYPYDVEKSDSLSYSFQDDYYNADFLDNFYIRYSMQAEDDMIYVNFANSDGNLNSFSYETDDGIIFDQNASYGLDKQSFVQSLTNFITNYRIGYSNGYNDGLIEGTSGTAMNPEMFTIFNGILNVAMIPVNVFLGVFNWEVFGINIASLISSLLSIAILIVVIRLIAGSSTKGGS